MERNKTLINFEGLREFIIENKIKSMKKNTKLADVKDSCLQEFKEVKLQ